MTTSDSGVGGKVTPIDFDKNHLLEKSILPLLIPKDLLPLWALFGYGLV